jgi:hypothetical protein
MKQGFAMILPENRAEQKRPWSASIATAYSDKKTAAFGPPAVLKILCQVFSTPQADRHKNNNSRNKNRICLSGIAWSIPSVYLAHSNGGRNECQEAHSLFPCSGASQAAPGHDHRPGH